MSKKELKWQSEILERIPKMSNEEVLDRYSYLCGGDDYDGCMTDRGQWEYDKIIDELSKRLIACGFLKQHLNAEVH